jgi:hypothetical protein
MDLRAGGRWRCVVTSQAIGDGAPAYRPTVTFADVDGAWGRAVLETYFFFSLK